jgi:phenylacetate-CoA ligase
MPIWNPEAETRGRDDIVQVQLERLQTAVFRCYKDVSFYKKKFDSLRISPEDTQSLDDLRKLPFTTKADLRDSYPYGMFAVPLREIVRIHSSSGMTGLPAVVGYTRNDLKNWSDLCARIMFAAGVTHDDVVQIAFDYGIFTGAFGFHQGAERIGASVIPTSVGHTDRQVKIIQDYRTSALACTPTYALVIADKMDEMDIDPKSTSLRIGLFGAEPWSEATRAEIERRLHIKAADNYGLTEVIGPGVAGECEARAGLHIQEDHFIAEIIDPESLEVLPEGAQGELVLTTLTKEGFPLIRYRTGDITAIDTKKCACGRTLARMARVFHRTDDVIIVGGVNIFPLLIENILRQFVGELPDYQIVVDRKESKDEVRINVEVTEKLFQDEVRALSELRRKMEKALQAGAGVSMKLKLVEPNSIRRNGGPVKRVVDNR